MTTNPYIIEQDCPECGEKGYVDRKVLGQFVPSPRCHGTYTEKWVRNPCSCTNGKAKMNVILRKKCIGLGRKCLNGQVWEADMTGELVLKKCLECHSKGYIERPMMQEEAEEIGLTGALPNIIRTTIEELIKRKHVINGWTLTELEVVE